MSQKNLQPPQRSLAIWVPLLVVMLIAGVITVIVWRVYGIKVKRDSKSHELILPGNIQAFTEATLYARTNGYIKSWQTDMGCKVKAGDLLAEIEAPDVDAQLRQSAANLAQNRANLEIARLNFERTKDLLQKRVISQEEFDTSRTTLEAQQASVNAGVAGMQNLSVEQGFQKITAPFTGMITKRLVDIGTLVSSGGGSTGTMLFNLQQNDPLRIFVAVPQSESRSISLGMTARVLIQEYPGQNFEGTVVRTAGAIDPTSRTLLTEIDLPNPDGKLYAGMYGQVKFILKDLNSPILLTANALTFHPAGPQVAMVTNENRIHWQDVKVGRDFGATLEITAGLEENATVVMNPTDDLREGTVVKLR